MPNWKKLNAQEKAMSSQLNREKTRRTIKQLLNNMKTEADPHLLNEYRSLFKKEVSLFRRSWAAAYLLMLCEQGKPLAFMGPDTAARARPADKFEKNRSRKFGDAGRNQDRQGRAPERPERNPRPRSDEGGPKAPYPLPDGDSRRLFINVGRNRRVFPREILGLINTKTAIPKENIGAIRILENYSFIQVRDTVADRIIEALNGQPFRGRILTVSYARDRNEEGGEPAAFDGRDDGGFTDDGPGPDDGAPADTGPATDNGPGPDNGAPADTGPATDNGPGPDDGAPADTGPATDDGPGPDDGVPADTDDGAHDVYYGVFLDSFRTVKPSPANQGAEGADTGKGPDEPEGLSEQGEDHPDKKDI
jgi:hypothetical protein